VAAVILLVVACHGEGVDACGKLGDPIAREECRYDAVRTVATDDAALDAALAGIEDAGSRDLVLYRLARDLPERAHALCGRTTTPAMRDKCDKVLGRPHLSGPPKP
jgi:hypothetical protein